jgi:tripartite-type tricarboxylate transporter receptor subunit TctC
LPALLPHVTSGKLRPLAAASTARNKLLPNVPTFAELGLQGMEVALWYGLVAPAGTPDPIVKRLNAELQRVLALDAVKEAFAKQSVDAAPGSPEAFRDFMQAEMSRWGKVVKSAGIQPE